MPNKLTHCVVAAAITSAVTISSEVNKGKQTLAPICGAALAALCTNLPDKLEPAIHPHHRQFFHSLAFAGLIGSGMYALYQWEAESEMEKLIKFCSLVVGGSYLIHLAADACTKRSIPLLGKF